jgi:cysteine-rich repeat protein
MLRQLLAWVGLDRISATLHRPMMESRRLAALLFLAGCGPSPGGAAEATTEVVATTTAATAISSTGLTEATDGASQCGNGIVEEGEACDDGTADANDECDDLCRWRRQEQWYLHIDDGGLSGAPGCWGSTRGLAVTPDLFAVHVGCLRQDSDQFRARQVAATPDGALAGRMEWDGKVEWVVAPELARSTLGPTVWPHKSER